MKNQWKLVVSIIILILVVIFALQNTNAVVVDVFFAKYSVPLVLVILLSLLLGVIVGLVASFSAISVYRKEKGLAQKELNQFKETQLLSVSAKDEELTRLRAQVKELQQQQKNTMNVELEEAIPVVMNEVNDGE